MPELPEVQTLVNQLSKEVIGKKITEIAVIDPRVGNTLPEEIKGQLLDQIILDVTRRGKNLITFFSNDTAAVVHLMISGRIYLLENDTPKGCMLKIYLEDGKSICFCYLHLGYFELFPTAEILNEPHLAPLGPDMLDISAAHFSSRLNDFKGNIKAALLNQKVVAGIGNIYVDEVLNKSKISPTRKSGTLGDSEIKVLHGNIRKTLFKSIEHRGTTIASWSDLYGNNGNYQKYLIVVGRDSQECKNCKNIIIKTKVAGRTTYHCQNCQE